MKIIISALLILALIATPLAYAHPKLLDANAQTSFSNGTLIEHYVQLPTKEKKDTSYEPPFLSEPWFQKNIILVLGVTIPTIVGGYWSILFREELSSLLRR